MKAWLTGWRLSGRAAGALKALPCLLLLVVTARRTHGQDRAIIDSARHILDTARDARNRVDALNAWAFEYRRDDVDSGIALANEALRVSSTAGYHKGLGGAYDCMTALVFNAHPDSSVIYGRLAVKEFTLARDTAGMAESMMHLATAHLVGADYDSALHYARICTRLSFQNSALSLSAKRRRLISIQGLMGNIFYYMSYYDSSIIYARAAMQLARQEQLWDEVSTNLIAIANVHAAESNYPLAIAYMKQAAALGMSSGEEQNYVTCLSDIATFLQEGKISRAQSRLYADSAIRAGNRIQYYRHLPHNLMTLADLAQEEGRYPEALGYYQEALAACNRYQNPFIAAATNVSLGRLYLKTNKANEATLAFQAALGSGEGDLERMAHCYEGLGEAAAMRHDYARAYDFDRKATMLHDSVFNDQNRETINEIEIRYKTREKQEEIHRLALSNDLQAARAGQKETEKRVAYVSIGAILLFGGFGFNRYRRIKRVEQERALLTDRLQIGRDLHDDLASSISSISLYGAAVKSKLQQSKAGEAAQLVDKMCADAQEVAASMSDALWLINPTNDSFEKLTDRMRLLADSLLSAHDIDLRFKSDESLEQLPLPLQVRKNIYLIFKEALNNLLKYAQATEASVSIRRAEGMLELCVEDNGLGLPKEASARPGFGGNGLRNMQARAARIGGTLELVSPPSGGVKMILRCPIPKIEDAHRLPGDVSLS